MTTTYKARGVWTPTAAKGDPLPAADVDEIDVHYPASGNVRLQGLSEAQVASRLRGWRDYHVNQRGWVDIGYNMAVDGAGRIWTLRGLDRVGAHAASDSNPSQNRHSIGVLFVIGDDEEPTTACINAFRQLRADILKRSPRATRLRGHQQVNGASTECPGDPLMDLISAGVLAGSPRPTDPQEDDDMTPEQFLALLKNKAVRQEINNILAEGFRDGPTTRRELAEIAGIGVHGQWLGRSGPHIGTAIQSMYQWAKAEAAAGNPRAVAALAAVEAEPAAVTEAEAESVYPGDAYDGRNGGGQ
ncbi:peptidoglycan recognition family protein [Jiangella sp. DSM 45060]|uniref:peptidoglycan recognition protein family protein n=1 Tax=Jiangella sp. DSM 45060 TaxID=1798224 RepID=UPI00087B6323|nr:peptidoglycan recognition family protein [Jiangella sp. DSM 45060]SDT69538.1 hypothetical protein SAMN04515669_6036 [Jiangella sp. DSM 45060]